MNNVIIATALNDHVRIRIIDSTNICNDANTHHNLYPTSLAALGRVISITALMSLELKHPEEYITTSINGGGPIGSIVCVGDSVGNVKGFVGDNQIYLKYNDSDKLAVGIAVGVDGYLKVRKDLKLKEPYTSQVKLVSGEIGDDFSYFFALSEQVKSIVSCGVLVDTDYTCLKAGAMIIELLPNHSEEDIVFLEELTKSLKPLSNELLLNSIEDYLKSIFKDLKILEYKNYRYHCDCSKERFKRNLLTLPKQDLIELSQDQEVKIRCEFCNITYVYTKNDIEQLLKYV